MTLMSAANDEPPPALHELESKVMAAVWERDRATVREILDDINTHEARPLAYTTILTIMGRLYAKRILQRERNHRTDVYRARYSREQYTEARAAAEVQALVDEFGEMALVHFTRQVQNLDPEHRAALRRIARRD